MGKVKPATARPALSAFQTRGPFRAMESKLKAFARTKRPEALKGLIPDINMSLKQINAADRKRFSAVLSAKTGADGIYEYLRTCTYIRHVELSKNWDSVDKGPKGNGSLGPDKEAAKPLIKDHLDRNKHFVYMTRAGEALLSGAYKSLYDGFYFTDTGIRLPSATPDLSPGKLEGLGSLLAGNFNTTELEILRLTMALHDIGRILQDKVHPKTGEILTQEMRHNITGPVLVEPLLLAFGYNKAKIKVIQFLIRHHSSAWDLYCFREFNKYNNGTTPENFEAALDELVKDCRTVESSKIRKMLAIISIADAHASGNWYLSDKFLDFLKTDLI